MTAKDQETKHIRQASITNGYPKGAIQHNVGQPTYKQTSLSSHSPVYMIRVSLSL